MMEKYKEYLFCGIKIPLKPKACCKKHLHNEVKVIKSSLKAALLSKLKPKYANDTK